MSRASGHEGDGEEDGGSFIRGIEPYAPLGILSVCHDAVWMRVYQISIFKLKRVKEIPRVLGKGKRESMDQVSWMCRHFE